MKNSRLCLLFIVIFSPSNITANNINDTLFNIQNHNNPMPPTLFVLLAGTYYYVENAWWSDNTKDFHFDKGADLTYALNVDKAGHFMGGVLVSELAYEYFFIDQKNKEAIYQSAGIGFLTQLAIEVKDGYAPHWGFSFGDLISGGAGALFFIGKKTLPSFEMIDVKFSYWKHSNSYSRIERQRYLATEGRNPKNLWYEDYPNQTYWLSFDVKKITEKEYWPDYLNIAIGFGLDDTQKLNSNLTKVGGKNEFYLAIDYNIPKLFKKYNSPKAKKIKKWLNYFKFPAPTIQIYPTTKIYPFFL